MERRRYQRAPLVREAVAYFGNTVAQGRTVDVSAGGLALAMPDAQRPGQFARVSWSFAAGIWVDADVVVVRVDRSSSEWLLGTSFLNGNSGLLRQIEQFVSQIGTVPGANLSGIVQRVGSAIPLGPPSSQSPPHRERAITAPFLAPHSGSAQSTPPVPDAARRTGTPPFRAPSSPAASPGPSPSPRAPLDGPPSTPSGPPSTKPTDRHKRTPTGYPELAAQLPHSKDELRQLFEDALRDVNAKSHKLVKR